MARVALAEDIFDIALEKLWIHGGAIVDYADNIARGQGAFRSGYLAQREHKLGAVREDAVVLRTRVLPHARTGPLLRRYGRLPAPLRSL